MYELKTIGYKWVKLKAHGKNYKMPKDVWDELIRTNRFSGQVGKKFKVCRELQGRVA